MSQITDLKDKNNLEDLEKNKKEIIDSVAQETGMESHSEKKLIENTVDNLILDEEFEDKNISQSKISETSIIEDIFNYLKGGKVITKGKITDVDKKSTITGGDKLCVTINIDQNNDSYTKSFRYNNEMSDELESLFILTGVMSASPSDLVGKMVPLTHDHRGGEKYEYEIHWPPKSGLISKMSYKTNRILRKLKIFNLAEGRQYDFKYKPSYRLYVFLFILIYTLGSTSPVLMTVLITSIFGIALYHTVVLLEMFDIV